MQALSAKPGSVSFEQAFRLLGRGGEHVVYENSAYPEIVFKIAMPFVRRFLGMNRSLGQSPGTFSEAHRCFAERETERLRRRHRRLRAYFGRRHTLPQRVLLTEIALTGPVHEALASIAGIATLTHCWAAVIVQARAHALQDAERISLASGYAESREMSPGLYRQSNIRWLYNQNRQSPFDYRLFLATQGTRGLLKILKLAAVESDFHRHVSKLVSRMICYTNESEELLDLAPANNLVFVRREGRWHHLLIDALYPVREHGLAYARYLLEKIESGNPLKTKQRRFLVTAVNYIRTVNGLAHALDISQRIDIAPKKLKNRLIDLSPHVAVPDVYIKTGRYI